MTQLRYTAKRHVVGELIYVFSLRIDERWMKLENLPSRALKVGEIHELIVSSDAGLKPGAGVKDVAYIGFFEVETSGIAEIGDEVWSDDCHLGTLAGFDLTHYPNQLNIVLATHDARTGAELELNLGRAIRFQSPSSIHD